MVGLAGSHLAARNVDAAKQMLAALPPAAANDPAVVALRARVDLAAQTAALGDPTALAARIAADPKDHQARFDLALIENARNNREAAADHLLEIVMRSRSWEDEKARKQLVTFFEAWGPMDPATLYARRRLSSLLFS
jgi:putative thioredoxin